MDNKKMLNEIGETPKGQYALGAVRGRALGRTLYQSKYQKPSERDKQGEKMDKAFFKAYNHRNNVDDPNQLEDMVKSYRKGFDYGVEKGMRENIDASNKQIVRLTEGDLREIVVETVNNILSELNWQTYDKASQKALKQSRNAEKQGNKKMKTKKYKQALKFNDASDKRYEKETYGKSAKEKKKMLDDYYKE